MSMQREDIEKLHSCGFIDEEQRDKIIGHFQLEEASAERWLFTCLSLLATLLVIGGVGMLIEAHWEDMSDMSKALTGGVILAAVWGLYLGVRKRRPLLGEGLATIGGVLWGLNIMLHALIFDYELPPAESAFYFFIGIAPLPFITRQRGLIWIVIGASVALLCTIAQTRESDASWLYVPWLSQHIGNFFAAFSLLGIGWWLIGEKSRGSTGTLRGYHVPGVIVFLVLLLGAQVALLYGGRDPMEIPLSWQGYALLSAAPALCLLLKPRGTRWGSWLLMAGATCAIMPLIIHLSWMREQWYPSAAIFGERSAGVWSIRAATVYGVAFCIAYALILLITGTRERRSAWINYGSLMVIFIIIGVMANIFQAMEKSGVALIVSGSLVVIVLSLLERHRRRLVKKLIAQATPSEK